jgi:hypothetical protein
MAQFTVGAHNYSVGKLSAFDQFHVARKLGTVLLWIGNATLGDDEMPKPGEAEKPKPKPKTPEQEARNFAQSICAMAAPLSRDDAEMAISLCLSVVSRNLGEGKGFAPVRQNGNMMYSDIELPQMLELVWHVLKENRLHDFFSASPSAAGAKPVAE